MADEHTLVSHPAGAEADDAAAAISRHSAPLTVDAGLGSDRAKFTRPRFGGPGVPGCGQRTVAHDPVAIPDDPMNTSGFVAPSPALTDVEFNFRHPNAAAAMVAVEGGAAAIVVGAVADGSVRIGAQFPAKSAPETTVGEPVNKDEVEPWAAGSAVIFAAAALAGVSFLLNFFFCFRPGRVIPDVLDGTAPE